LAMPHAEGLRPRTFLFADLRGYTAYVEQHGDVAAAALLARYREIVRAAIAENSGVEVKTEGDSFYLVFDSSVGAGRCAMAIQHQAAQEQSEGLENGLGGHEGEAVDFDAQYVGSAVNIAARLAGLAVSGEVLISETVRGLIRTALSVPFESRGALPLKGIDEPIRAHSWRAVAPPKFVVSRPVRSAMDAIHGGDLGRARELASAIRKDEAAGDRCNALVAVSLLAAARGDLEAAFSRSEQLLGVASQAADRSWRQAAFALQSWLYSLARQPGEARAELDRAFDRLGAGPMTALPLLLAVSLGGTPGHAERLRQMGVTAQQSPLGAACQAIADVLEGTSPALARPPGHRSGRWTCPRGRHGVAARGPAPGATPVRSW